MRLRRGPWRVAHLCSCGMYHFGQPVVSICPKCGDLYPYLGLRSVRSVYRTRWLFLKEHIRWEERGGP